MRIVKLLIILAVLAVTGTLWALNNGTENTAAKVCPAKASCGAQADCAECPAMCSGSDAR